MIKVLFSFYTVWKYVDLQVNELKATVDGLEKERDFYFGKLRDIEVICQEMEEQQNAPIVQKILDILYATEVCILFIGIFINPKCIIIDYN